MSDTEYLTWVAEHLVMFRPAFSSAYMEYVDDFGFEHTLTYISPNNGLGDLEMLKECIDKVNESV